MRHRFAALVEVSLFVFMVTVTGLAWAQGASRHTETLSGWNGLRFGMAPNEVRAATTLKLRPADIGYGPIGTASEPALFMTDVSVDTIKYVVLLWFINVNMAGGEDYRLNDITLFTETADRSGELSPCPLGRVVRSLTAKYGPPVESDVNGGSWLFLRHREITVASQSLEQDSCKVTIHYSALDIRPKLQLPAPSPAQY